MLGKLAVRNVKRQMGSYLIYFVTVAVTVALMFSVNNVLFSDIVLARVRDTGALQVGLGFATAVVSLIVAFVISYAGSYMLKLRKREFGTYMTLGLSRGDVLKLFGLETLCIGLISLCVGIVLGLGLFQAFMLFVRKIMELDAGLTGYSWRAFVLTAGIVVLMFAVSSVGSAMYLKRVKIYDLLHSSRYVDKRRARPVLWGVIAALSLGVVIACIVGFLPIIRWMRNGDDMMLASYITLLDIVALIAAVFLFSIALAKSVTGLLLKSRRFKAKGTNTFVLRQLTAKLNTNAVLFGVLAVLMTCAVIASNFSFTLKASEETHIQKSYPFSAAACWRRDDPPAIGLEQAEEAFARYVGDIGARTTVELYESDDSTIYEHSAYARYGPEAQDADRLIRLSDYNRLRTMLGRDPVETDGYLVLDMYTGYGNNVERFADVQLDLGGQTLRCRGVYEEDVGLGSAVDEFLVTVVPDAALEGRPAFADFYCWQFASETFDGMALYDELLEPHSYPNGLTYMHTVYSVRRAMWARSIANSAVWIVAAVYIAIVFVFVSMAVLALKSLSDIAENRKRYRTLFQLGLGAAGQNAALFQEIFTFFILPFLLPICLSVPTVLICAALMQMMSFAANIIYINGLVLIGIFVAVYLFYMLAAFAVNRNASLRGQR